MSISDADARKRLDGASEYLADTQEYIEEGTVDRDNPSVLRSLAMSHDSIAHCLAVLGRTDEARAQFRTTAETTLEHIEAAWDHGDEDAIRALPMKISSGMKRALIAGDDDLATRLGQEALNLGEVDRSRFALASDLRAKEVFEILSAQLWGAIYLDEPLASEVFDEYREAVRAENARHLVPMADIFEGLAAGDQAAVREGIRRRVDLHEERFADGYDNLTNAVATTEAAFVHLAAHKGIDVSVDSPFLPDAMLPPNSRSEAKSSAAPDPLLAVSYTWDEESGELVLEREMDFEADREFSVDDLPEDDHGMVLTDEWLENVRAAVAETPDAVDSAVREALESGNVERRLIVFTPMSHAHMFDETFRDQDIDKIDIRRG